MSRVLRTLRAPRNVLSLGRRVNGRIDSSSNPGCVQLEYVKVRQRRLPPLTLAAWGVFLFACYHVYTALPGPSPNEKVQDSAARNEREERAAAGTNRQPASRRSLPDDSDELDDDTFFLTLPFTARKIPQPRYERTDPAFQDFVNFHKDEKKRAEIENEFCRYAQRHFENSIWGARHSRNTSIRGKAVKFTYPAAPPPIFVRKVVFYDSSGFISIIEKPIDAQVLARIERVLYPWPVAKSLWAFSSTLMQQNFEAVSRSFGYSQPDVSMRNIEKALDKTDQQIKTIADSLSSPSQQRHSPSQTTAEGGMPRKDPTSTTSRDASVPSGPGPTTKVRPGLSAEPTSAGKVDKPKRVRDFTLVRMASEHVGEQPWEKMKETWKKTWRQPARAPPPGSLIVEGLVYLDTPTAVVTMHAEMHCNPKTRRLDYDSAVLRIREIRYKPKPRTA